MVNKRLEAADRWYQALELRRAGMEYREIARRLGYAGPSGPYKAVESALRETLREPADAIRQIELQRLDNMLAAVWSKALEGDTKAIDVVLKLQDRRSKYLGLDSPQKLDIESRIRILAEQLGLDPELAVAEAQNILRDTRGA